MCEKDDVKVFRWRKRTVNSALCVIGALLMVVGESVLGGNHSGIATVVGIIGIGIIGTFNTKLMRARAKRREA